MVVWFDDECCHAKQLERTVRRVHFQPLPRRLPSRGVLKDVLTSTCSVGSDRRVGRNGSTPISHILVVYGGLLMNFSAVVGRRLRISTLRTCIATSTTRLPKFELLLPVLIHHNSRRAVQSEARLLRSVQFLQTTSRLQCWSLCCLDIVARGPSRSGVCLHLVWCYSSRHRELSDDGCVVVIQGFLCTVSCDLRISLHC